MNVIIGCKLPNGIIMELIEPRKESRQPLPPGKRIVLNGANTSVIARLNPADVAFGVTEVEEEFAKKWFKANADLDFIKSGAVFMVANRPAFKAEAIERHEEVRTGLEPLNATEPDKDVRMTRGVGADDKHMQALLGEKRSAVV